MLTDTHTHLYDPDFAGGGAEAVRRAVEAGVGHMIFPNVDLASIAPLKQLASEFPENISKAMGLHPTEVRPESLSDDLAVIRRELADGKEYVAVGEVGMDLYWSKEHERAQAEAFDIQCGLAAVLGLPVIIHCREALPQVLEVLQAHPDTRAVFHSFGGSADDVRAIRRLLPEAFFGINGIVTFKNSGLRDVLPEIGIEKIVLETDSPYLAPVPKRGRRNESAYLPYIAATTGDALGLTPTQTAVATTDNAARLFGDTIRRKS